MHTKKHKLGYANFLGRPIQQRQTHKHTQPIFGSISIPKKQSVSLWNPSMNKPAATFWGDADRDGIYNGLDCKPFNPRLQGPWHSNEEISENLRQQLARRNNKPQRRLPSRTIRGTSGKAYRRPSQRIQQPKNYDYASRFNKQLKVIQIQDEMDNENDWQPTSKADKEFLRRGQARDEQEEENRFHQQLVDRGFVAEVDDNDTIDNAVFKDDLENYKERKQKEDWEKSGVIAKDIQKSFIGGLREAIKEQSINDEFKNVKSDIAKAEKDIQTIRGKHQSAQDLLDEV